MRPGALPNSQLILLDLLAPPIIAGAWWLMSGGLAGIIQGGSISAETKARQIREFWILLILIYLIAFGVTIYAWSTSGPSRSLAAPTQPAMVHLTAKFVHFGV